jgi:DNA-binding response OmpR family regulator
MESIVKTRNNLVSVMIIGESPDIQNRLNSDLAVLGYETFTGGYPDIDMDKIATKNPHILMLELTEWNGASVSACKLLLRRGILPAGTALVALVSEDVMGNIPLEYEFADIIKFPYSITELGFRFRRLVYRFRDRPGKDTIEFGDLPMSLANYEVEIARQPVLLSLKEYELLKYLITNPNRVLKREELLIGVWGYDLFSGSRTVDVHIRRVRAKIQDFDHRYIKTIRGVGYTLRFDADLPEK